jgi:uncharacterized membrane-anchored protein YhcB (DUF1043 family)
MKKIRIFVGVIFVGAFCWLNWRVLPYLAIVRLEPASISWPPPSNLILIKYINHKIQEYSFIKDIHSSWTGVLAAYPYVIVGIIIGLKIGYIIGEFVRRKFAIDAASEEIVNRSKRIMDEAQNMKRQNEIYFSKVRQTELDNLKLAEALTKEIDVARRVRETADEDIQIYKRKLNEREKERQDLLRASETIKKLSAKINHMKKESQEGNERRNKSEMFGLESAD